MIGWRVHPPDIARYFSSGLSEISLKACADYWYLPPIFRIRWVLDSSVQVTHCGGAPTRWRRLLQGLELRFSWRLVAERHAFFDEGKIVRLTNFDTAVGH